MKRANHKRLAKRKRRIEQRLAPRNWTDQPRPMFRASNIQYEVSERIEATVPGGIGAVQVMNRRLGVDRKINESLVLLKRHLPYHESDHVLNMAYNVLAGGTRLEDLELLRQDESYTDMLGAQRIPDPTTAGDFLRRFSGADVETLMDCMNGVRVGIWRRQPEEFRETAVLDLDGSIVPTYGEKKSGMGLSYKGIWGYHPLLVTLANTGEPLYIVNRPGSVPSHWGCVGWIDKAVALVSGVFSRVLLRGDTDFSLTREFDRWTEQGVRFVFGYDAHANLVQKAAALPRRAYRRLEREGPESVGEAREKRENAKEQYVVEKEYRNIKLRSEEVAEVEYQPVKCRRPYRLVILRKNLSVESGERVLFDDVRYFFYITNDREMTGAEVVAQANARCDQENVIEQLKNGVNALRVPVYDLESNWAYMVIASLAWTFKAWFGLTLPRGSDRAAIVGMEFKKFLNTVMRVPCQVVRGARTIRLRLLAYTSRAHLLLASLLATRRLCRT